ncbi:MAG: glycosyltransferase family 9 protein [Armatimonadota bacterium]|jgi:ADP-heptose:LPS heptosyltransferase
MDSFRYDCRLFNGYKPCRYDSECKSCEHYAPKGARVLVLRVTQLGNIVKSTPILHALHRRYDDPWVTWVCSAVAAPMLRGNPLVNEVIEWSWEAVPLLQARSFDLVLSLEANAAEAALGQSIRTDQRLGFGIHESGSLIPVNEQSVAYVSLSLSDRLRFEENQKTLAELCFELVGVPYAGEEYILCPSEDDLAYARGLLARLGVEPEREAVIGLATGGDTQRFPNKDWPIEHFGRLARILSERTDAKVLLLGGPMERELNARLAAELGDAVIDTGCDHAMMQFAALMSLCDVSVSADSFVFHVAVAMKTHVVGLFGPTPPQEMAIFGRGRKLVTEMDCAPCYIRRPEDCPHDVACMWGLTPETVAEATLEVLAEARREGA